MLEPYRRHLKTCPYADKGIGHSRCNCPVWCDGQLNGKRFRRSLGTRSWSRAEEKIGLLEKGKVQIVPQTRTVERCVQEFIRDCRARNLAPGTVYKYSNALRHLASKLGSVDIADLDLTSLTNYRAGREIAASTSRTELEVIRQFCGWCHDRDWTPKNYAKKVRMPKDDSEPTMPFSDEEVGKLLAACGRLRESNVESPEFSRVRARALVLLLVNTGLRISDAAALKKSAIGDGYITLYITQKTKVPIRALLDQDTRDALAKLPGKHPRYFWTSGALDTCVHKLRRVIARLGEMTDIHAHPHRFRDTFACRLLMNGEDIRTVSLLLGHRSVRVTEKHYAPFIHAQQKLLDAALTRLHNKSA